MKEIDEAIAWARARAIHTNLCLHRAPGYTVATPKESLDLWSDGPGGDEARGQFAGQWRMFAARHRGIPSELLSFNLVNEPPSITAEQYLRAAAPAVAAIRAEDPQRLIIADGRSGGSFGRVPTAELASLGVAQSTRGYSPGTVTHYRAPWVGGSDTWPVPSWPLVGFNAYLYGDSKRAWQSPLLLRVDLPNAAQFAINVQMVSAHARLVVRADGATVLKLSLNPGPGAGEWKQARFIEQYNIYQAVYDKTYTARLPAGTREIAVQVTDGDWLTFSEIRIGPYPRLPGPELILRAGFAEWGVRQHAYAVRADGSLGGLHGPARYDKTTLWSEQIEPWQRAESMGIGVHVGEWGAFRFTPHDVVLAWMADCLDNWKRTGWGWALWNLRGGFGPVDSQRSDVVYEDYRGHKLDRRMLALLLRG